MEETNTRSRWHPVAIIQASVAYDLHQRRGCRGGEKYFKGEADRIYWHIRYKLRKEN